MDRTKLKHKNYSDQIGDFNLSNHRFIQDPNAPKSNDIQPSDVMEDSLKRSSNSSLNQENLQNFLNVKNKETPHDPRFQEFLLKDATKYLYLTRKLIDTPEYKKKSHELEEYHANCRLATYLGFFYLTYLVFKIVDRRHLEYANLDDLIHDKKKIVVIRNNSFHFGVFFSLGMILLWNKRQINVVGAKYDKIIHQKYLTKLKINDENRFKITQYN